MYHALFSEMYLFCGMLVINYKNVVWALCLGYCDCLQGASFLSPYKRNSVQLQMLDENSLEIVTNSTVTLRNKMDTNPVIKREGNY